MRLSLPSEFNAERAARCAAVLVTDVEGGEQRLLRVEDVGGDLRAQELQNHLRTGKSGLVERDGRQSS